MTGDFLFRPDVLRERLLVAGATPGTVTMLPNVTVASAVVLSALDLAPPRNRIVLVDGEFPTVRYLGETLGPRLGDRAFDAIDDIRASRAWERWTNRPTVVT